MFFLKFKKYYSQFGEDISIKTLLSVLFQKNPENLHYVDIGSNEPVIDNNTYYFYKKGGKGICIDPNPYFIEKYKKIRPNDIFINAGVRFSPNIKTATYYDFGMKAHCLNTFSETRKNEVIKNYSLEKEHCIELVDINDILKRLDEIDIVSLDVEGLELPILSSLNFSKYRPKLFCIEANKTDIFCGYESTLVKFMKDKGYVLAADNFINQIFVDTRQIKNDHLTCYERKL